MKTYIITSLEELRDDEKSNQSKKSLLKRFWKWRSNSKQECQHINIEYLNIYNDKNHKGGYKMGKRCSDCFKINMPDLSNLAGNNLINYYGGKN